MASGIISYHKPAMKRRIMAGQTPEWMRLHVRSQYIIGAILATAFWVDKKELWKIDRRAKELTAKTGILHVVDHDIPINHPRVCGLTVPENLVVMTWFHNQQKGGRWCDSDQEQFTLDLDDQSTHT